MLCLEAPKRLFAVACLENAEALLLEWIREELLHSRLVVDEEDRGGVGRGRFHVKSRCLPIPRPTIEPLWPPSRLHRSGADRVAARSSDRSTAASIEARGCSSGCRYSCSPSAWRARRRSSLPTCRRRSTKPQRRRSPPTSRRAGRAACPVRPGPRARHAGSSRSFGLTASRCVARPSSRTSLATDESTS